MSANLRNREYVINNRQLDKNQYEKKMDNYELNRYSVQKSLVQEFGSLKKRALCKYANILKSTEAIGDNIISSKKVYKSFDIRDSENISYSARVLAVKDSMDVNNAGCNCELFYEGMNIGLNDGRYKFSVDCWDGCFDIQYCDLCMGCLNSFGCVGMRKKQYCILNKQYTKEEYETFVPKIIEHMNDMPYIDKKDRVYKYGEFFPPEISPFAYNETVAQDYIPLTDKDAVERGFNWHDTSERNYKTTISWKDLPDTIQEVSGSITGEIISCAHENKCNHQCTGAFKIVKDELNFYKQMNLPLPRLCPNCRHYERLKQRNPLKLWHRQCMCDKNHPHHSGKCTNEFETSYAPDRPEIVYCEKCYQQEVV
jgi:hypothetical protein